MESLNISNRFLGNSNSNDSRLFETNQNDFNVPGDINIEPTQNFAFACDFENITPMDGQNPNAQEIIPFDNMNDSNQNLMEKQDEDSNINVDDQLTTTESSLSFDNNSNNSNQDLIDISNNFKMDFNSQSNNATNEFCNVKDEQEDLDFLTDLKKKTNNINCNDIKKEQDKSKLKFIDEIKLDLTNFSIMNENPSSSNAHKLNGCKNNPKKQLSIKKERVN